MKRILYVLAAWLSLPPFAFAAPSLRDASLSVVEAAAGLSAPTTMAFIGAQDILVLQKGDGRVRRIIAGALQPSAVLDVAVDSASERGLLGIAVHPNFPAEPFVYLYFTESTTSSDTSGAAAGKSRVSLYLGWRDADGSAAHFGFARYILDRTTTAASFCSGPTENSTSSSAT